MGGFAFHLIHAVFGAPYNPSHSAAAGIKRRLKRQVSDLLTCKHCLLVIHHGYWAKYKQEKLNSYLSPQQTFNLSSEFIQYFCYPRNLSHLVLPFNDPTASLTSPARLPTNSLMGFAALSRSPPTSTWAAVGPFVRMFIIIRVLTNERFACLARARRMISLGPFVNFLSLCRLFPHSELPSEQAYNTCAVSAVAEYN